MNIFEYKNIISDVIYHHCDFIACPDLREMKRTKSNKLKYEKIIGNFTFFSCIDYQL